VYDVISAEERNTPAVGIFNEGFIEDAHSAASSRAMPAIRAIPSAIPCEATDMNDIASGVDLILDQVINAMTRPLTDEEKSPRSREPEKYARIVFKGSLDEVNRFFYKRGWSDGLPIIPPTEDKVAEMLMGTDLAPGTLLGKLIPRKGKVTVEKIAINAVMAGALPTLMPVLIAATQLLLDSEPGFQGFCTFGVSTGSWSPFWIINGPIRNDIRVNNKSGSFSPGNIANAAIGRAMGLIIKNLGGIRKGIEDMGVMGNPMKYTMVVAENEEESPWEPLHVEFGLKKEDSAVTISYPQSYLQHWPISTDDEGILRSVMDYLHRAFTHNLVFNPAHARILAKAGWSKKDIKDFLSEFARNPVIKQQGVGGTLLGSLYKGRITPRVGETVRIIQDPRTIRIIVAGGPGAFIAHVSGGGPTSGNHEIQKIELPRNWDKLVAKYQDMVPNYVRY
jgi:hypothetical protein